jgi:hypothetical protein
VSDIRGALPDGHVISSCHVRWGGLISTVLFSLYVNDLPTPSHHVKLTLYTDDTAIIATSRKLMLLVSYLESYLSGLQQLLSEWRMAVNISKSFVTILL